MQIPTNPMYDIDENAVVRLISTGAVIPEYINHHGKRAVKIRGKSHKPASHPLDRLMLITYKPPKANYSTEWLSVAHLNGNKDDVSIDNLEWDYSWYAPSVIPGLTIPRDSWIKAYNYPSIEFKITPNRIMFRNAETLAEIGTKESSRGYLFIAVPRTQSTAEVHLVVAETLLPHPIDTAHLVVNHKDSNKHNNHPNNLEWATYSQNNFHAYSEGPRSETIRKIRLKNVVTHDEVVVSGYQEMARYLGVFPQGAHQAMERRTYEGRPFKGYLCKYEDDPRTWDELQKSGRKEACAISDTIAVKDMHTGDVRIYTNFRELLSAENIRDFMVYRLLRNKIMVPWRGRCFQEVVNDRPLKWPNYPDYILEVYNRTHASDRPIKVTDSEGYISFYTGVTEWCMEDRVNRCDPAVLSRYMKKGKGEPIQWNGYIFEHIDLSTYTVS